MPVRRQRPAKLRLPSAGKCSQGSDRRRVSTVLPLPIAANSFGSRTAVQVSARSRQTSAMPGRPARSTSPPLAPARTRGRAVVPANGCVLKFPLTADRDPSEMEAVEESPAPGSESVSTPTVIRAAKSSREKAARTTRAPKGFAADCRSFSSAQPQAHSPPVWPSSDLSPGSRAAVASRPEPSAPAARQRPRSAKGIPRTARCRWPAPFVQRLLRISRDSEACCLEPFLPTPSEMHLPHKSLFP